ncbi:uncharacterized protein LOC113281928 [Papaver somniferum]|uniref:uncharacterized protein LOC113281928 n=1 Tax=Papaver somniferum TaxID=3469 RepID=UPI000E6FEB8F|nr:uncharacterized protein LOC113281928 [Papaver somniferum]
MVLRCWWYGGAREFYECDTLPTAQDQIPMPVDGAVGGDPAAAECSDDDLEDEISNKGDLKDEISNKDDLKDEIFELLLEIEEALDNIELRTLPPLDVKIPADQLEALLKKWGLDSVKCGDYPPHLQSFGKDIEFLKVRDRETADFGKYAAAGKYSGRRPYWVDFKKWYDAGGMVELESSESKNERDALPTAQDQIPMPVDGASSVADRH